MRFARAISVKAQVNFMGFLLNFTRGLVLAAALQFAVIPAFALTLNVDSSGQLQGASNVLVGGAYYDLSFVDGTCFDVFDGCDVFSQQFVFDTQQEATEASLAIMSQVLIDVPGLGDFDSDTTLTNGCSPTLSGYCQIYTVFNFGTDGADMAYIANYDSVEDFVQVGYFFGIGPNATTVQFDIKGDSVWAVWEPSQVVPVPVPAMLWVFAGSLIGLRWFSRGRTNV